MTSVTTDTTPPKLYLVVGYDGSAPASRALRPAGALWVSWPKGKGKAKIPTDLDEGIVRTIGLDAGLVDVKVCAVDEVWSGLKFVRRRRDR